MIQAQPFFVPDSNPETWESDYAKLASFTGKPVPPLEQRIYSITFVHDGEEWTATVGESLNGFRLGWTDRKHTTTKRLNPVSDPAKVLAILAGEKTHLVFIKYPQTGYARSAWSNPIHVGEHAIKDEIRFATPE